MKDKKATDKSSLPKGFIKNPDLDKYADKVLFKEKVEKANRIVKAAGLPKE